MAAAEEVEVEVVDGLAAVAAAVDDDAVSTVETLFICDVTDHEPEVGEQVGIGVVNGVQRRDWFFGKLRSAEVDRFAIDF